MKKTSNINCNEKLFINIKKLSLIKNIRIDELIILIIDNEKKIMQKRN